MLFNSFQFMVFFPVVAGVCFLLPWRWRAGWLLLASYVFYMAWEPAYVLLLMLSTGVDYAAARGIEAATAPRRRKLWLGLSLAVNLGVLWTFKYLGFFAGALAGLLAPWDGSAPFPGVDLLLPVGISFYTFQTLGYTIDVFRGKQKAEHRLDRFALYVAFFPQLVAGPIERAGNLLPQLARRHDFDYDRVTSGLRLMLWGLFKKVVIADRLAHVVDSIYVQPAGQPGPVLALATVCFGYQIYCDFSGYSDMAIGAARVLGIRLMRNFDRPYAAGSVREFWQRWHISLSTWFRDYVYLPLGGSHCTTQRWVRNILVVFVVSGLWHGAAWHFVCWGLLHGLLLLAERALGRRLSWQVPRCLRVAATFLCVQVTWVFFRADTMGTAWTILRQLPTGWDSWGVMLHVTPDSLPLSLGLIVFLETAQALHARSGEEDWLAARPLYVRWAIYSAGLWAIFLFGVLNQREFIYFVF